MDKKYLISGVLLLAITPACLLFSDYFSPQQDKPPAVTEISKPQASTPEKKAGTFIAAAADREQVAVASATDENDKAETRPVPAAPSDSPPDTNSTNDLAGIDPSLLETEAESADSGGGPEYEALLQQVIALEEGSGLYFEPPQETEMYPEAQASMEQASASESLQADLAVELDEGQMAILENEEMLSSYEGEL